MASKNIVAKGTTYNGVESVTFPVSGGGDATFYEISDTTAAAADVASGKYFYTALGVLTQGTASGGGGGLVYETGTWTPSEDVSTSHWIDFTDTHTVAPFFYVIWDATATFDSTSNCNGGTEYCNFGQLGEPLHTSATSSRYGYARKFMRAGSHSTSNISYPYTNPGDSSTGYPRYWAKETGIRAEPYSTGYIWQTGHTFKWIAVWAPTT